MEKNISINISGIIFHIEESGYTLLKDYLDSINSYFSSFQESKEIILDIENRIAEIFLSKLNSKKQIIVKADVEKLITTMGSIKDFEAVEDPLTEDKEYDDYESRPKRKKKLLRDKKRKLLGGVAAGISNYFGIDPVWTRITFVILFLLLNGVIAIGYIICWIVLPITDDLEDEQNIKKIFRNPKDKVISGVSSGLAAYFGVEPSIVRLTFIIATLFNGAGLIVYLILWMITPEAKTITDTIQMQGEPVTLSNIESSIKKSLKVDNSQETLLTKIILLPFRLLAQIFTFLSKILGPLFKTILEILRITTGVILALLGVLLLVTQIYAVGIQVGWFPFTGNLPIELIINTIPSMLFMSAHLILLSTCLGLIIAGISVAVKSQIKPFLGWSLFTFFLLGIIGLALFSPSVFQHFQKDGSHYQKEWFPISHKNTLIELKEVGLDDYEAVSLNIKGHKDSTIKVDLNYEAKGKSRIEAIQNAQMVSYNISLKDSSLIFDSNLKFKKNAQFRVQKLDMTLYLPPNHPFTLDKKILYILNKKETLYPYDYSIRDVKKENWWIFNNNYELQCLTCSSD